MVNVLKFQTLFLFFHKIKCWLSIVRTAKREDPDQTASSEAA